MPVNERVCAIVVTHNRSALVRSCIASLLRQSRPVDRIVVVDNASTDSTREMLAREFPGVHVLAMEENMGASGGFREGMSFARAADYDWYWLLDDDVEALPDALDVLLQHRHLSDFLHLRKRGVDNPGSWEGLWDLHRLELRMYPREFSFENGKPWTTVNYGNFEGGLVNRRIVDRIGFPDPRFFMSSDDAVYGYLASFHTNVLYINHVGFYRMLPFWKELNRLSCYLVFRNRFLVREYLTGKGITLSRTIFWFDLFREMWWCVRHVAAHFRRWPLLVAMMQGVSDGVRCRFGRPAWL